MRSCPRCSEAIRTVTVTRHGGDRREDWTCVRGHLTENAVVQTKHPAKKRMVDA